jgi:hypothetical protein
MAIIDDTTLVVAESHADRISAWMITDDGSLVNRRVWAALREGEAPDGICVDADGAIWYASVPGQHCVRVAEGGRVLATVETDRGCFACMLGGNDGQTLVHRRQPILRCRCLRRCGAYRASRRETCRPALTPPVNNVLGWCIADRLSDSDGVCCDD